ncbi:hypothetical protein [Devosia sp.]|uniref:hypothetical protein n=1 Tax=Devosia sp. TaxID=1871048 RepID=UPI003BA94C0E
MKGAKTWEEIRAELPQELQDKITEGAKELGKTIRLQEIRELAAKKQAEVEGMTQAGVSRLEGRKDWLVSSLNTYVRGLGGTLKLVATLPDVGDVELAIGPNGKLVKQKAPARRKTKPAA